MLSWSTYYLVQVKHMSTTTGLLGFAMFELPAIPGTIIIGWLTDKYFGSRRAPMSVICMVLFIAALLVYWHSNTAWVLLLCLSAMGIFIYGPLALIGILALDLVPKKAGGTAAGFVGLFGYMFGTVGAQAVISVVATYFGWNAVFSLLVGSCVIATILLGICWNLKSSHKIMNILNLDKTINIPKTLYYCLKNFYQPASIVITKEPQIDKDSKRAEYDACYLGLNNYKVLHLSAKITPKYLGGFVALWKRSLMTNKIEPIDTNDGIDFVIISFQDNNHIGQYIFNRDTLVRNKIFSTNNQKGKLSFRIYPSWIDAKTKSAQFSQRWQNQNYVSFLNNKKTAIKSISDIFYQPSI